MLLLMALLAGALSDDPAFVEGTKLYDQLEYEQAVFRFQEVTLKPELSSEERATALAWLGLCYAGAGNLEPARRAFEDAGAAWPEVKLPVEVAPALAQLFEEARAEGARRHAASGAPTGPGPAPTPPEAAPLPVLPLVAAVAGGAALVGGVGLLGISWLTFDGAQDKQLYQDEAKARLDTANLELGVSWALIPLGAALAGASAWLFLDGGAS